MASEPVSKVTITIEQQELTGGTHLHVTIESEPPMPIAKVTDPKWLELLESDEDLDMEKATQAQLAARLAVGEIAGQAEAALVMVRSKR